MLKDSSSIELNQDSDFIAFRHWLTIKYLTKDLIPEIRRHETLLYLDADSVKPSHSLPLKSDLAIKNSFHFPILNLKIIYAGKNVEVFSLNIFPKGKTLQVKFLQAGTYRLMYFLPWTAESKQCSLIVHPIHGARKTESALNFRRTLKPLR